MTVDTSDPKTGGSHAGSIATARLFVAGDSAYSVIALASLRSAIADLPVATAPEVIVIDMQQNPATGFEYRVFVTPTLILTTRGHDGAPLTSTMIGDLGDGRKIGAFLSRLLE